jgi:hypothetical protein
MCPLRITWAWATAACQSALDWSLCAPQVSRQSAAAAAAGGVLARFVVMFALW